MTVIPLKQRAGYDLVASDALSVPGGFTYAKEAQGTNTSGTYKLWHHGERVGRAALTFRLKDQRVYFDIEILRRGNNLGSAALRGLADTLGERGFDLVTNGISPDSREYWEHLAERGDVVPLEPKDPETQYRVMPHAPAEPALKED